jgi:RNA polymerase primary sigma factor
MVAVMNQVNEQQVADDERVATLVAQMSEVAAGDILDRSTADGLIAAAALPARLYRSLLLVIAQSGLTISEAPIDRGIDETDRAPDVPVLPLDAPEPRDPGWDANGFDHFMACNRHRLLTAAEERVLAAEVQRGRLAEDALTCAPLPVDVRRDFERKARSGLRAQEELIRCNLRLVLSIVRKHRGYATPGMDFDDLFQEGVLGLQRAIVKFDPDRGFKLSTYATWWIRQSISRAIADHGRSVRIPVHMWEQVRTVWAVGAELGSGNQPATAQAVAEFLDWPVERVREIRRIGRAVDSLDRPTANNRSTIGELVAAPIGADPSEVVEARSLSGALADLLETLTQRERNVIMLRFGLEDGEKRTLEEVGELFGVTRERIRQIEAKVLAKLRNPAALEPLRAFVDFRVDLDAQRTRDAERLGKKASAGNRSNGEEA